MYAIRSYYVIAPPCGTDGGVTKSSVTTGEEEPCLLAYAWIGTQDRLAAPGMKLTATRKVSGPTTPN